MKIQKVKTSVHAIYFLIVAVFALAMIFMAETTNMPPSPEYLATTQRGAPSEPSVCGLDVVNCPNEVEDQIRQIAASMNFKWPDYLVRLAKCESGFNPKALGDGGYRSRGVFQISEYYWPTVTDQQAYDVDFATRWTIEKVNAGQQGLWSCDKKI